ncbi:MAG: SIS domain-containing protein [Salinisphaeraceae bacterium]|nr:SIS domain-containing protein [Salinisphaeraceae bacterium]
MNEKFQNLITKYPDLEITLPAIEAAYTLLETTYAQGGKLLICGNGGSAADSEHIVGELMKGFTLSRPVPHDVRQRLTSAFPDNGRYLADHLQGALPAISLVSQTGLITAFANDVAGDMIFAQQVYGYGRSGDVTWGISTSGNSRNVIHALQVGQAVGLKTLGLTGQSGGQMAALCDVTICVPWRETADVQERHLAIYHALCTALEVRFFGA